MARTKRTIPVELNVTTPDAPDEDGTHESVRSSPFFAAVDQADEILDHIVISREKPIREGQLGMLAADASEDDIREIYGGGTFRLIGRTERKKPIKGAFTTVDLAGDPIFTNDISRRKWESIKRQQLGDEVKPPTPAGPDAGAVEEARHQRMLERIKAEAEAAVSKARAEVEAREAADERRRKREREDREEERRRDRDEREAAEERRWKAEAALRKQEREDRDALEERRRKEDIDERRAEREQRQDPTELLMRGMQIAMSMSGGNSGPEDPVTAFIARGPELLAGMKDLAVSAGMGGGARKPNPSAANSNARGASEKIELEGALADRVRRTAAALMKAGKKPEQIISQAMAKALDEVTPRSKAALPARSAPALKAKPAKARRR